MANTKNEVVRDAEILFHPLRFKIIEALESNPQGMYINELADKLKEDRQLVAFHLLTLASHDLVEGEYKITQPPHSKGKAVKVYRPSEKVRKLLEALEKELHLKLADKI